MSSITLDQAQRRLPELILSLSTGGDVLILDANIPVARLSPVTPLAARPSLREHQSSSVGALVRPYPSPDDDLLAEMLPSVS